MNRRVQREQDLREAMGALWPRMRRFATVLTGSSSEGDELVQAACERALSRLDQLRIETRLDAWMYRIIRTVWLDELRARRVRRHEPLESAHEVMGDDGNAIADSRLGLAAARRALADLPEELRAVLVLVSVDGLRYREAAEVLDIPIGTVMSRLARARATMLARLTPDASDGKLVPLVRAK
jgi:RNA polymerase sigma-70 factor (ECF subfamily)